MKIFSVLLILVFTPCLYSDVMYEMTTTTSGFMGMGGSETQAIVFIKGNWSRREATSTDPLTGEMTSITITRLDDGVIWHLDIENEEYTEEKIALEPDSLNGDTAGISLPEISVEHTGNKKVLLKKDCEEVIVTMKVKSEEKDIDYVQTMWVTVDIPGYDEITEFNRRRSEMVLAPSSGIVGLDESSYEAFQKEVSAIDGFPLECLISMVMGVEEMAIEVNIHSTVSKIEQVPINERVFQIPVGFKRKE
jgi:hypothetical protein